MPKQTRRRLAARGQNENTTHPAKVALRRQLLRHVPDPIVLETHGGGGMVFRAVYPEIRQGIVFERDRERAELLAVQRPTWSVYEADVEAALRAGVGRHLVPTVLDVDPYGSSWEVLAAFFESERPFAPRLAVAVTDGHRRFAKFARAWASAALQPAVRRYGNSAIYDRYLEIARETFARIVAAADYRVAVWHGYYTGARGDMTHFGAILERRP